MNTNNKTNGEKLIETLLQGKSEEVKFGVDVHARELVTSIQEDGSMPQRGRRMSRELLVGVAKALVGAGKKVYVVQECGPCGYVLHRELEAAGAVSYVVTARDLTDGRRQKTDGLDAVELVNNLDRFLRGHRKAMTVIRVPSEEEERARAQSRLRDQLRDSRQQWSSRGRSLLLAQGYHVSGEWWTPRAWRKLCAETALPDWLREELDVMRTVLLELDVQEKTRRKSLEKAAPKELPKAMGALSWVQLLREMCSWERFSNRRQVGGYTGLCAGVDQSGGRCRDGSINRYGNPRVRHLLIEMIWRLERWQPDYPPVRGQTEDVMS